MAHAPGGANNMHPLSWGRGTNGKDSEWGGGGGGAQT